MKRKSHRSRSDAKLLLIKLQQGGRHYSTIKTARGVLRPAFQMAVDEDVLRKNLFGFEMPRWRAMKKYKKMHPDTPFPHITPHMFRHTFCTNMANVGMDIKTLQYVIGHSDVGVTLNVYTHASYDRAAEQMTRIVGTGINLLLPFQEDIKWIIRGKVP